MKATALALAVGLAAAGPTWAQDAEPVREKRLEAERHLVPCEQVPDSERDCRAITRRFLDAYDKATRGHWPSRLTVGSMLILGGRVPGKPQSYVVPDPVEGCAWRIVAADDHPDRNVTIGLRTLCNRLTAPDRATAEERARDLRQNIAPAVAIHQGPGDAERLAEAQRPEAQSRQSAAALWRGERPARPPPTTPAPDAPVAAEPPESGHAQQPRPLARSRAEETARKAGVVVADAAHCGAAPTRLARVQGSTEAALALLGRDDRERTAAVRVFHEAR